MIKGKTLDVPPKIIKATPWQWKSYLHSRIDQIIIILCNKVTNDITCVVCGKLSPHFNGLPGLAIHLRYHKDATLEYFLENYIVKYKDNKNDL